MKSVNSWSQRAAIFANVIQGIFEIMFSKKLAQVSASISSLAVLSLGAGVMFSAENIPAKQSPPTNIPGTTVKELASDIYGTVAFVRGHWATSINKMVVLLTPGKDTSVRAYDPVTNTWEFLWPQNTLGVQGRDNFASFYIPRLDEIWVWDGSYLWDNPASLYSGRFHVSKKKWLATGHKNSDAFVGVVDFSACGAMPFSGTDPAMAWAGKSDAGLMLGGSNDSGEWTFLFERKVGGPEEYKATQLKIPRPPWRAQCENAMASDGKDFYLCGGFYQDSGKPERLMRKDLWKFDLASKSWSELPSPPDMEYAPVLTYDSDLNVLLTWVKNKIYVYNIAAKSWSEQTPPGCRTISNQIGVYCPTGKIHVFEGGNDGDNDGGAVRNIMGLTLSAAAQTAPAKSTKKTNKP